MKRFLLFALVGLMFSRVLAGLNTKTQCANLVPLAFVATVGQTNVKTFQFYAAAPGTNRQFVFTFSATGLPAVASLSSSGLLTMTVKSSDIGTTFSGINITFTDSTVSTQTVSGLTISVRTNKSYYVATTGHDTGAGTVGDPFLTIGKGAVVSLPGDTINIASGLYQEKPLVPGGRGSSPPDGFEQSAGVNGPDKTTFIATSTTNAICNGFRIFRDYTRIDGLTFTNFHDRAIDGHANKVDIINNFFVNANAVQGSGEHGWAIGFNWYQWPRGWFVATNHLYKCQSGIYAYCWDGLFTWNNIERLYNSNSQYDSDYHVVWGENNEFSYNFLHGTIPAEVVNGHVDGWQFFDEPANNSGGSGSWTRNTHIHHNWVEDFDEGIEHEGSYNKMSETISFHHNVVHHGLVNHPDSVHKNGVRPLIFRDVPNVTVTNNTFSTVTYPLVWIQSTTDRATNGVFKDNICYNYTVETGSYSFFNPFGVAQSQASAKSVGDYNTAYPGPLSPFPGAHDIVQNPQFVNAANPLGPDGLPFTADDGFILLTNSPALTSSSTGGQVGAYEAVSGGGGPPGSNGPPSIVGAGFRATKVRR